MDDEIVIVNQQNDYNTNANNINPNNRLLDEQNLNMIKTYLSDDRVHKKIVNAILYYHSVNIYKGGRKKDLSEGVKYLINKL